MLKVLFVGVSVFYVTAKHLGAAQCSITTDETVGSVYGLILKQFTVASLIGCGTNPSQSCIQQEEEDCGGDSDCVNH